MIITHVVKTLPRLVESALVECLRLMPAVVVTGARLAGAMALGASALACVEASLPLEMTGVEWRLDSIVTQSGTIEAAVSRDDLETAFLPRLPDVDSYALEDGSLILSTASQDRLHFRAP
jgi:hypothetical protein